MPCIPLRGEVGGGCDDIILGLDEDGDLPTARRFKDPHQELHCLLEHVWGAHVNLCHHHKHRDTEGKGQTKMFCIKEEIVFKCTSTRTHHYLQEIFQIIHMCDVVL